MGSGAAVKTGLSRKLDPSKRSADAIEFENALRRKIIGQENVIEGVTSIYQTFLAGLNAEGRPVATMLFLGPTGTGKTRTVEAMAEILFGDARAMIKIDCAEFQHSHEIAKLIGSPPGYLGHRETHPLLTQEALNHWHTEKLKLSLLLFDEIEKSSDALWNLLLGILDKGTITLGDNRRVDMTHCMIFMTSNLGAADMATLLGDTGVGFSRVARSAREDISANKEAQLIKVAEEAAKRKFTPEFMNRIDKVVAFKPLKNEMLKIILNIELGRVQQRILHAVTTNPFVFTVSDEAKQKLLDWGTDRRYGARALKRTIEKRIVHPLANLSSTGQLKLGDYVSIELEPDNPEEFCFTVRAEGAMVSFLMEHYGRDMIIPPRALSQTKPTTSSLASGEAGNLLRSTLTGGGLV